MTTVKVKTLMKHGKNKVGETYELSEAQAKALVAIGLVEPANQTAAKVVEKAGKPE
jgi:hypothetical protein